MKPLRFFHTYSPYISKSYGIKFYIEVLRSGKVQSKVYGVTVFCGHRAFGVLY